MALNSAQFGSGYPGPNCGRSITISANGKQVQATIADQCPSCGYGELDLSEGLFTQFAGTGAGVFDMTWWYNSGSGSPGGGQPQQQPAPEPTTTHKPSPTPEYTPPPPPTSTYTPPAPTSTYTPPPPETSTAAPVQIQVASSSSSAAPSSSSYSSASSATQASATLLPSSSANGTTSDTATMMVGGSGINNATNLAQMGNLAMINAAVAQLGRIVVVGAGGH